MKVAVVLSGCGALDGTEIHEAVSVLIQLSRAGAAYQCFAPDIAQAHGVDHLTGDSAARESRNVLVESARIARRAIKPPPTRLNEKSATVLCINDELAK